MKNPKTAEDIVKPLPTPKTVKELHAFFKQIPNKFWCVGIRANNKGQHCALGLLDLKFGCYCDDHLPKEVSNWKIAEANNGGNFSCEQDSKAKTRVLKYLRDKIKESDNANLPSIS